MRWKVLQDFDRDVRKEPATGLKILDSEVTDTVQNRSPELNQDW